MNSTLRLAVGLAVITMAHAVTAQVVECDRINHVNCLNGVSSSVTNGANLRIGGATGADVARSRMERHGDDEQQAALDGRQSGLSAGDLLGGFGAWVNYRGSWYEGDFTFAGSTLAYDADTDRGTIGLDRLLADRFLLGLSLSYEDTDTDTFYNGGGQESDGFTIAPYAAWLINDNFTADIAAGYTPLDNEQERISPTDGTTTSSSFDSDRWFVAANLNAIGMFNNWVLGGRVGVLHTSESQDAYTETGSATSAGAGTLRTVAERDLELTQLVLGGDVAYSFGSLEPYALLIYRNDVSRDNDETAGGLPGAFTTVQADDDDEVEAGFGFRVFSSFGVTTNFEWSIIEGRDSFDGHNLSLTIRGEL
jgi:outer membrane autotransporter protein